MYIPEGYGTVFPYFVVNDAARFVDFLKNAFDANEVGRTVAPNGRIANCNHDSIVRSCRVAGPGNVSISPHRLNSATPSAATS